MDRTQACGACNVGSIPTGRTCMKNNSCIFCKIIIREEPASFVYEDDEIIGFMNHKPIHVGECLIIPKKHIDHFTDIDGKLAGHIMEIAQRLATKIKEKFHPQRIGYVVSGYGVPHAHFIIVPLHHTNDITSEHFAFLENNEIHFSDKHIPLATREELDGIANEIRL